MLDPHSLYEYSLSLKDSFEDRELQKRLELFQVFSKLYERHRDLLNEILALEQTGAKIPGQLGFFNYIQGVVLDRQAFLMTNLLQGQSQILVQPQHIWVIGRDTSQVSLSVRDKRLSRRHAAIQYRDDGFYITDLGSTNGTFVNGERIRHPLFLQDGDRVRLGSMTFTFFACNSGQELPPVDPEVLSHLKQTQLPETLPDHESIIEAFSCAEEAEIPPFVFEETLRFIRHRSRHN
ncbi:MAG: FHA domain-containing protein [Cyanobacteria bacterium Co-bin8]|nr:FHA domain-containing protein [Cyanobacteria bacterium Co-bin8]